MNGRQYFRTLVVVVTLATTSAVPQLDAIPATAATGSHHSGDLDSAGTEAAACTPLARTTLMYVDPAGHKASKWASGRALKATFRRGTSTITEVSFPPGFLGRTNAKTLATLGLGRSDNPQLNYMMHRMEMGTQTAATSPAEGSLAPAPNTALCESNTANTLISPNWSGRLAYTSNVTQVEGQLTVPTYSAVCDHASGHSTWVGFGGFQSNSKGLIQAGFSASQSSVDAVYPWFEVFPKELEVPVSNPAMSPGQNVDVMATYDSHDATSYFAFTNITTGAGATYTETGDANYVDPSTAEWIDERPSNSSLQFPVDGSYYYYRKSTRTSWTTEYTNGGTPIGTTGTDITMKRSNNVVLATAIVGTNNSSSTWKACA